MIVSFSIYLVALIFATTRQNGNAPICPMQKATQNKYQTINSPYPRIDLETWKSWSAGGEAGWMQVEEISADKSTWKGEAPEQSAWETAAEKEQSGCIWRGDM